MKFWRWEKGRAEGTNYWKFTLWYFKIGKWGFDGYILKYAPKTLLKPHIDPIKNGKHWRLNIRLFGRSYFSLTEKNDVKEYANVYNTVHRRFIFFRPDIQKHTLLVGANGCVKLSFGFVKFN